MDTDPSDIMSLLGGGTGDLWIAKYELRSTKHETLELSVSGVIFTIPGIESRTGDGASLTGYNQDCRSGFSEGRTEAIK